MTQQDKEELNSVVDMLNIEKEIAKLEENLLTLKNKKTCLQSNLYQLFNKYLSGKYFVWVYADGIRFTHILEQPTSHLTEGALVEATYYNVSYVSITLCTKVHYKIDVVLNSLNEGNLYEITKKEYNEYTNKLTDIKQTLNDLITKGTKKQL